MPIGKSAIKRVSSAGYANLKNEAPDMENSVVAVEEKSAPVQNKTATKTTAKKPAPKKAEAKPEAKKPAAKKPAKAEVKASVLPRGAETAVMITESFKANEPESKGYYNLGDDMPVYLL